MVISLFSTGSLISPNNQNPVFLQHLNDYYWRDANHLVFIKPSRQRFNKGRVLQALRGFCYRVEFVTKEKNGSYL